MAMGIVSTDDFDSELDKLNAPKEVVKIHVPTVVKDIQRGRTPGAVGVPDGLRKIIGDESITNGRDSAIALAADFGISESSVSAYAKGATSTATYNERPNEGIINGAKERISKKARIRLLASLNILTPEKIATANAKDVSSIAKDMSVIVKNMDPAPSPNGVEGNGKPAFLVYSPTFNQENHYATVVVKE